MPTFFFLAGLWVTRSSRKPVTGFFVDKLGTILYPYLLWSLIQYCVHLMMAGFTNGRPQPLNLLRFAYLPYAQFWFLYVLFINLMLATVLLRSRAGFALLIVSGVGLHFLSPYLKEFPWPVASQVCDKFLYVVAGACCSSWLLQGRRDAAVRADVLGVATGLVALSVGFWLWHGRGVGPALFCAAAGTLFIVAASRLIQRNVFGRYLEFLGRHSLEIFVAHVLATAGVRIALVHLGHVASPSIHLVLEVTAGLVLPLSLALLASHLKLDFLFVLRRRLPTVGAKAEVPCRLSPKTT
jgi:fucose 4-O-acetylase-like acetyltransferase